MRHGSATLLTPSRAPAQNSTHRDRHGGTVGGELAELEVEGLEDEPGVVREDGVAEAPRVAHVALQQLRRQWARALERVHAPLQRVAPARLSRRREPQDSRRRRCACEHSRERVALAARWRALMTDRVERRAASAGEAPRLCAHQCAHS